MITERMDRLERRMKLLSQTMEKIEKQITSFELRLQETKKHIDYCYGIVQGHEALQDSVRVMKSDLHLVISQCPRIIDCENEDAGGGGGAAVEEKKKEEKK